MDEDRAVICICGVLASGKTTLVRRLSDGLDGASVLVFDEYEAFSEWPADFEAWRAEGCDPSQVRVPRLREDLEALHAGQSVTHPMDEHEVQPSPLLLVEDPFGRTRPDIRALYDLVLFVDLPFDLSVVRMAQRALNLGLDRHGTPVGERSRDELAEQVERAESWLANYTMLRDMYTVLAEPVRASADAVLDGRQPPDALYEEALVTIRDRGYLRQ